MISGHVPAGLNISITHKPVNDFKVAVQEYQTTGSSDYQINQGFKHKL